MDLLFQVWSERVGREERTKDLRFRGCAGVVVVPCVSLLGGALGQVGWPVAGLATKLPTEPPRPMSRGWWPSMQTAGPTASTIVSSLESSSVTAAST